MLSVGVEGSMVAMKIRPGSEVVLAAKDYVLVGMLMAHFSKSCVCIQARGFL